MDFDLIPHQLQFKFKAGTSRGFYTQHDVWYVVLSHNGKRGIGEIAPLKGLSIDHVPSLEDIIVEKANELLKFTLPTDFASVQQLLDNLKLEKYPSIRFGFEVALLDLINGGDQKIFNNDFIEGKLEIPINGLIWMGDKNFMLEQVKQKIAQGFSCIKMKIGAIDFQQECAVLEYIRAHFSEDQIELRVDANGAFKAEEAFEKLEKLSTYNIHSIEQPIQPKQWKTMQELCEKSPIPIALDEELIGIYEVEEKREMLKQIKPPYIILKPTLLGGLQKTNEWIQIAESLNIDWWLTSALESNIGLNAISQFVSKYKSDLPQGLGTGGLYHNNIESPLNVEGGFMKYDKTKKWNIPF